MTVLSVLTRFLILTALALGISGCSPMGDTPADEEKDPFYLEGKSRYASMDRDGAINAYEKALISNPKSAAAHRELGLLYAEKGNHTAALYHFEKHLELRPESNMAETIKQQMFSCKLELVKGVSYLMINQQAQEQMRKLTTTNQVLAEQVTLLKTQLVEQASSYSNKIAAVLQASLAARATPSSPGESERRPSLAEKASPVGTPTPYKSPSMGTPTPFKAPPSSATSALKAAQPIAMPTSHIVRSGETLASIARKYNLRLSSLQAANPGLDSRRMKAGQMVVLPKSRY